MRADAVARCSGGLRPGVADHRTPLTARGRRQADIRGPRIWAAHGPFDVAWHSGYARTRETPERLLVAAPARPRARLRVGHHLVLRERDTGYAYDMTEREVRRAFPWLQAYWDTYGPVFGRPPGGESLADVARRGYLFLNMVFREAAGKRVLVVSHGGTMWMLRMLLERWPWDEAERPYTTGVIPQCSAVSCSIAGPGGWWLPPRRSCTTSRPICALRPPATAAERPHPRPGRGRLKRQRPGPPVGDPGRANVRIERAGRGRRRRFTGSCSGSSASSRRRRRCRPTSGTTS